MEAKSTSQPPRIERLAHKIRALRVRADFLKKHIDEYERFPDTARYGKHMYDREEHAALNAAISLMENGHAEVVDGQAFNILSQLVEAMDAYQKPHGDLGRWGAVEEVLKKARRFVDEEAAE